MMQSKKIYAVTGGIGSGKSAACKILREMGYPVFSCDEVYSDLLEDKKFLKKIEDKFGCVTNEEGELDRKKLSGIVFTDDTARKALENIAHPAIMQELLKRAENADRNLVFCEVPLLFENGFEKLFDDVLVIMRNLKERVEAVKERSSLSESEVLARIAAQYDYSKIAEKDCIVVENNGTYADLQSTMRDIITKF